MRNKFRPWLSAGLWLCLIAGLQSGALSARGGEITVFAAASLTDVLRDLGARYEKSNGEKVILNFAASSVLARQIEQGAPADVFFSADEAKMDGLEQKGLILKGTRDSRLSNSLVIVVGSDSHLQIRAPADLASAEVQRVAVADPRAVPAGVYAKAFLERLKLWSAVEPKVIPTENVRAALAAVASGNVEAGIVFKTDAAISKRVKVACEIPGGPGLEIRYPVAVVKESNRVEAAKDFLHYLRSEQASKVFTQYGFIVLH